MRVKLIVAYDGTNYYGFQHQPNCLSIEDTILAAINKIDSKVTKVYGSGRTDRFVHAKGQVVHFDSQKELKDYRWVMAINAYLPEDIRILSASYVDESFHARFSAKSKEYHYYIRYKHFDLFYRNYMDFFANMDLDKLSSALKLLEGTHDFRGFCSAKICSEKDTVKEIYSATMDVFDEYLVLKFIGNGFLKYQVRKMVGTLVDIAIGKKDQAVINEIFETKDPKKSNRVLSGHGLYLISVNY